MNSKKNKNDLKKLWTYFSSSKKKIVLISFLSILSVLFNIISIIIIGFGLDIIILNSKEYWTIVIFISSLSIMYLLSSILNYLVSVWIIRISQNIGFLIRKDLFSKLQKLPFSFLDVQSTGDIMSRLTNDVEVVTTTLSQQGSQLFSGVITIIGMFIGMVLLSPMLTLILIVIFPILFSIIFIVLKKSQPFFIKKQKFTGNVNGHVEEYVSSQKVVNLFSYQKVSEYKFRELNNNLSIATNKAQLISGFIFPYNNFINNVMLMLMTLVSILFIVNNIPFYSAIPSLEQNSGIGLIFAFILLQRQFTMPISNFMSMINQFQLALAGSKRFFEILDTDEEKECVKNKKIKINKANVEFKNISFSYDDKKLIIKNLSFNAKPGTINAIVGPTGSGKTTLISLLTRFYEIKLGSILIDKQDISQFSKKSLRENITIVLQDTFLFSESIRENINYGNLNSTEEEIINAAKNANAWHFIKQLPNGLDTIISSNNSVVSEGEKQLIAIARAFLSKAKIIILDEATSYVDTKTEKEIQEAMAKLMKGRTSFIIAHRLSTIKKSNNIIVLQDGELKEEGTHNSLLSKKGLYYKMIHSGMPEDN